MVRSNPKITKSFFDQPASKRFQKSAKLAYFFATEKKGFVKSKLSCEICFCINLTSKLSALKPTLPAHNENRK